MKKITFKGTEYWEDKNKNKFNCFDYSKADALEASSNLIFCFDCIDSKNCTFSRGLTNCIGCDFCEDCDNCKYSRHLTKKSNKFYEEAK